LQGEDCKLTHARYAHYEVEAKWYEIHKTYSTLDQLTPQHRGKEFTSVRGIFASMSGFTRGANTAAEELMNLRELLLFGPSDIKQLIERRERFSDILTKSLRQ
jgi:hypothetical protein